MLVTIRNASKAESADNITFVEFPRICGLRKTRIQITFPISPMNPTVFVIIPWRINVKKINSGSSSLFPSDLKKSIVNNNEPGDRINEVAKHFEVGIY